MLLVMKFNGTYFANGSLFEPVELSVGQKELFFPNQEPEAVRGNICYFNEGSADAMRCVFHICWHITVIHCLPSCPFVMPFFFSLQVH